MTETDNDRHLKEIERLRRFAALRRLLHVRREKKNRYIVRKDELPDGFEEVPLRKRGKK